ncbi:MAG: hybrid sensor histidine kinase/response regulator [Rhodospirillaceae bacterium]|nr:hybrid sensor histidine kinase/response regulator [Rhodospirillaceae bacterium]
MNRVLVIEDSSFFLNVIKTNFASETGVEIVTAMTLKEAEAHLENSVEDFALALVDLRLPDANDGEAVDLTIKYGVPSIVFTSNFDEDIRERYLEKGILDFVLKDNPSSLEYLLKLIRRVIRNRDIKALVVDDSTVARHFCSGFLERYQLQVIEAKSGEEALEIFKAQPDIRLIITDHEMPGMSGYDLITKLRRTHGLDKLAIIGVSAAGGALLSAKFIKHGANDFLAKPYLPEELYTRVALNLDMLDGLDDLATEVAIQNRFFGIISHDLKGPLNPILGMTEMLTSMQDKLSPEKMAELAESINVATQRQLELVNSLLEWSSSHIKGRQIEWDNVVVSGVVETVFSELEAVAGGKGVTLVSDTSDAIARTDPQALSTIIRNLVSNSIKFTEPGGGVAVSAEKKGNAIEIVVADNGVGIDAQILPNVFDVSIKTTRKGTANEEGTGLGLPICAELVKKHGGEIGIGPRDGGTGTIAWLRLPIAVSTDT